MRRVLLSMMAALVVGTLAAAPAAGQGGEPTQVRVSERSVAPGGPVRIQGQGWEPDSRVVFELDGQEIGETTTDVRGRFRAQLRLPAGIEAGQYPITVTGQDQTGQELSLEDSITVSGTQETQGWPVIVAVAIGAVGVILVVAAILLLRRGRPGREELAGPSTQEPTPFEAGRNRTSR